MLSKLKNHNYLATQDPWFISGAIHALLITSTLVLIFGKFHRSAVDVDFEVIEAPKLSPQAVQLNQAKAPPKKARGHEVFGISRKSITSTEGEDVKAGNTIAKTPDLEKLKPSDADSLPVPSAEYMISQMPKLKFEVRIPYPPGAKKNGTQGAVVMDLLIDKNGQVREVVFIDGPASDLNAAALEAAKGFQFIPAMIQEKAVAVKIRYSYRFILEH